MTTAPSIAETATLSLSAHEARLLFRSGQYAGYTSSFCQGYVQGNLCILPQKYAFDFVTFCHRNYKACPLIAIGDVGESLSTNVG